PGIGRLRLQGRFFRRKGKQKHAPPKLVRSIGGACFSLPGPQGTPNSPPAPPYCTIGSMKRLATVLVLSAGAFAAAPEQFSTSKGALQITPIQHASLMIQAGGKVMYIDPAQGSYDGLPQADYILITDIHSDHLEAAVHRHSGAEGGVHDHHQRHGDFERRNQNHRRFSGGSHTHVQSDARAPAVPYQGARQRLYRDVWGEALLLLRRYGRHSRNEGATEYRRGVRVHEPALHDDARGGRRGGARVPPGGGLPVPLQRLRHEGVRQGARRQRHRRSPARLVSEIAGELYLPPRPAGAAMPPPIPLLSLEGGTMPFKRRYTAM